MRAQKVDDLIWKAKENWRQHLKDWEEALRQKIFPAFGRPPHSLDALVEWAGQCAMRDSEGGTPLPAIR